MHNDTCCLIDGLLSIALVIIRVNLRQKTLTDGFHIGDRIHKVCIYTHIQAII